MNVRFFIILGIVLTSCQSKNFLLERDINSLSYELYAMKILDQEFKMLSPKKLTNQDRILNNYIDSINTVRLIAITKKYGFPSHKRLKKVLGNTKDKRWTSSPQIIFVHSPKNYFKTLRKLIPKEYKKGRIDKNSYNYIFWHINGRKGNPFTENHTVYP